MGASNRQSELGKDGGLYIDDISLTAAAARELSSPLVLLRQLGFSVSDSKLSDRERQQLGQRLTLTSERALRMISSLSMASQYQQELALEPINPLSICQEVVHELSPLFLAHDRSIQIQTRSRIPLLVGNRHLLKKILLCFGDNALHYGSDNNPVKVTINGRGKYVRIGVRDYGPAIPANIWHVLDGRVSRRTGTAVSNRPHTSGVGLIAAKRLAALMHSSVGVKRHRDGATFYVELDVSDQMSLI